MSFLDGILGGSAKRKAEENLRKSEAYVTEVTGKSLKKQLDKGLIDKQQFNDRYKTQLDSTLPKQSAWANRIAGQNGTGLANAVSRNRIARPVLSGLAEGNVIKAAGDIGQLGAGAARLTGNKSLAEKLDRYAKPMAGLGKVDEQGEFRSRGFGDTLVRGAVQLGTDIPFFMVGGGAKKLASTASAVKKAKQVATTSKVARSVPVIKTFGNTANNQYQNSRNAGVNEAVAFGSAIGLGAGSAALERVGLGKIVKPGKLTTNLVSRTVGAGLTEGATEGGQQLLENTVAKNTYDPNRSYTQGVAQATLAGGLLGAGARGSIEVGTLAKNPGARVQEKANITRSPAAIKSDPQFQQFERRITGAIEQASQPNTPPALKANFLQEAKELIKQRNVYVRQQSQGGFVKNPLANDAPQVGKTDPLESLKQEAKPFVIPKTNPTDVTKLSNKDLEYYGKQGYTSITDKYGNTREITPVKSDGVQRLDSLNPTGGVFVDYNPKTRATMPLADNMTTYDKTAGKAPDELVTIYRGAPKNQKGIVAGDFITTNRELAKSYTGDGNVLEMQVPASHILDDIESPLGEEYLYRPTQSQPPKSPLTVEKKPTLQDALEGKSTKPQLPSFIKSEEDMQRYMSRITSSEVASELPDVPSNQNVPSASQNKNATLPTQNLQQVESQQRRTQQSVLNGKQSPLPKNTPKQLEIKDSTAQYSNEQNVIADNYAAVLQDMESGARGGDMVPDGEGGYKRVTSHSQFYRDYFAENKRKPSKQAWLDEAKRQLESGQAIPDLQRSFDQLNDPEYRSLVASQEQATGRGTIGDSAPGTLVDATAKVKQQNKENNIPVRKVTKQGDYITATNVNPNIKAKEKRFSQDESGNLIEDKKGAYSLFTDDEGKIKGFRIGDEYTDAASLGDLSTVNNYSSTVATMRRNIERSFDKETGDKVSRFLVDDQQARATKMIERQVEFNKGLQEQADSLGIKFSGLTGKKAKQVSADIQNFGEGKINLAELSEKYGGSYARKIVQADTWFRSQYDSLLDEMNTTLTKFGYEPVPKRKNYYTHFSEPKLWEKFGLRMQEIRDLASPTMQDASPDKARGSISNALAGESEFTQPNKKFNQYTLQRKGDKRTADAFQSFERYLSPTLNNIYMTPSITRARVLAKAVANDADLVGKDANGIMVQVKEYANNLSGKSSRVGDRFLSDTKMGRQYLALANWAQKKAGQNTIVGNLSTAVMQPIVLAQTAGKFGYKNTITGALQVMSGKTPIGQSEFMRRRYADTTSVRATSMDKARKVANTPLEIVERTAAQLTWNAAYNDALSQKLKGKEAMRYADIEAEKTLAGRAIGERPELYRSKAAAPFTMYQLEVNNYWQQFMKEMTPTQKAKTVVAGYVIGSLLKEVLGRDAGFNPIDAVIDAFGELGKEEKSAKDKALSAGQRLFGEVADNIPVLPQLATMLAGEKNVKKVLGQDSNIGRFGVSSPISSLATNPISLISPFGAGQVKKTYQGIKAVSSGGIDNKDGERQVDIPQTPENYIRGALFGKGSIKEVSQYYDNMGKKKVDQKPVQNQLGSTAGTQSLRGLTKDQQEMVRDLPENRKQAFIEKSISDNRLNRKSDEEYENIKESKKTGKLSNGQYVGTKNGEPYKFKSKKEADKSMFVEDFVAGDVKRKEYNGKIYTKADNDQGYSVQSKADYEFDKSMSGVAIQLDKAKAANDLGAYKTVAEKKYEALQKKLKGLDPDIDFKEIDSVNKQILDLEQEFDKYTSQGYIRKGKSGKGKNKGELDTTKMFAFGSPATSTNKSLRELLNSLT
jgi:hypothetical protein